MQAAAVVVVKTGLALAEQAEVAAEEKMSLLQL
jgi:hypothetical protein